MQRFINLWLTPVILLIAPAARAADLTIAPSDTSRALAFARYTTSYAERDPLTGAGPVGVIIEASVPGLYKSAVLAAVCQQEANGPRQFRVLQVAGDGVVAEEVIDRYLGLGGPIGLLPISSVTISPADYKFHLAGQVSTGGATAHIYDIAPKNNRPGLVDGRVWIDSATGREVMLSGHTTDLSGRGVRLDFVRDAVVLNGSGYARVTHVSFAIPLLGRVEVTITEMPMTPALQLQLQPQAQ